MIAAVHAVDGLLEDAEEAAESRPPELVVEGSRTQRRLDHDVQWGGEVTRCAECLALPSLFGAGDAQVGDGETGQPGLGLGPAARRPLVADLAARAGGGTGEGRDGGRMVVRLNLHQDVNLAVAPCVSARGVRHALGQPARAHRPGHDRGVVLIGHDRPGTSDLLGVPDHPEERSRLHLTVDDEVGVEDLVPAVLGVGLGKHRQLDVRGIARQASEGRDEIVDLVVRQGEPVCRVRRH